MKPGCSKRELAEALRKDIRDFKTKHKCSRLVMVWCASTEIFISPGPAHWTLEAFEKAIDANDPTIAPSMLYAYAAIMEGCPSPTAPRTSPAIFPRWSSWPRARACPSEGRTSRPGRP